MEIEECVYIMSTEANVLERGGYRRMNDSVSSFCSYRSPVLDIRVILARY